MKTAAIIHYHRMTTRAKVPTALCIDQGPATNPSTLSALHLLGVKFQLDILSVLNNKFDALVAPALALFKFVLQRRMRKINGDKRC